MIHFQRNIAIRQIWPLVTLMTKNGKHFRMYSLRAIERFSRAFLSFLVFELRGVVILTSPDPHQGEGGLDRHPGAG